eukprot:6200423-Pleurochrysis_carterae.AAC.4
MPALPLLLDPQSIEESKEVQKFLAELAKTVYWHSMHVRNWQRASSHVHTERIRKGVGLSLSCRYEMTVDEVMVMTNAACMQTDIWIIYA